jgi:hypothetical protein
VTISSLVSEPEKVENQSSTCGILSMDIDIDRFPTCREGAASGVAPVLADAVPYPLPLPGKWSSSSKERYCPVGAGPYALSEGML